VVGPLARPSALPRGTVPGLSAPSPGGNLSRLFPVVTPAPAVPGVGRAHPGPSDEGGGYTTALTAETGVIGGRQGSLIVLAISVALGLAVAGAWLTVAGPGRKAMLALVQSRKAVLSLAHGRKAVLSLMRKRGRHTH
jgi:hypothetical protein